MRAFVRDISTAAKEKGGREKATLQQIHWQGHMTVVVKWSEVEISFFLFSHPSHCSHVFPCTTLWLFSARPSYSSPTLMMSPANLPANLQHTQLNSSLCLFPVDRLNEREREPESKECLSWCASATNTSTHTEWELQESRKKNENQIAICTSAFLFLLFALW